MKIGINCGHTIDGQPGSGAVGFISESRETREVGKRLMAMLKAAGHKVYDCTNDYAGTTKENLAEIVAMANAQTLDLFVSIHFNSGGGKGTEVFTYGAEKLPEAKRVCDKLHTLGYINRGIKDGSHLYVIRHTKATAMLIEVCFVDSKTDTERYKDLSPQTVAAAIATAITSEDINDEDINDKEGLSMSQYEELKAKIEGLEPMIYNYVDDNMPEWARGTIQKLKDKGIIKGNEKGELGLTLDMLKILVWNDRAGLY